MPTRRHARLPPGAGLVARHGDPRGLVCVKHPLLAIAHLATLERHRATREATHDESSTEGSILVVVNRETWWDLSRLFETIRQRMPAVGSLVTDDIGVEQSEDGLGLRVSVRRNYADGA